MAAWFRRARPLTWLGCAFLVIGLVGAAVAYVGSEYRGLGSQTMPPFRSPGTWSVKFQPGIHALYALPLGAGNELRARDVQIRSANGVVLPAKEDRRSSFTDNGAGRLRSVASFDITKSGTYLVTVRKPKFDITVGFPVGTTVAPAAAWLVLSLFGVVISAVGLWTRIRSRRLC